MANTAATSPGTVADLGDGDTSWVNPNNVKVSDNTYATASGGLGGNFSGTLRCTNFGFSIPVGSTIDGVLVEIERLSDGASDSAVQLVKAGSATGTSKNGGAWSSTEAYVSYGGAADVWGATLTYSDVNASTFGVQLGANINPFATASVDHVRVTIYYTAGGGGGGTVTSKLCLLGVG
jgi:hypothetical protein